MAVPSGHANMNTPTNDNSVDEGEGNIRELGNNRQLVAEEDEMLQKKRLKQKQKITKIQMKKQQQKEQTLSTSKLVAKTQALRINVDEQEVVNAQTARYFHICIDKLALAFEKQFLKELPEYGNFKRQDQEYSPTSYNQRKDVYGFQENQQQAANKAKPKDILACAQATMMNTGQQQKSAAPAIKGETGLQKPPKKLGGNLQGNNPFFSAGVVPLNKKSIGQANNAMSDLGFKEDIQEYTVYKSKSEFDRLRSAIHNGQTTSTLLNLVILLFFGMAELLALIVQFYFQTGIPFLSIVAQLYFDADPDASESKDNKNNVLRAFIFAVVKCFIIVVWYFLSNFFIKQRKVTTIFKLKKWCYLMYAVWIICFILQVVYSSKSLGAILPEGDNNNVYLVFGATIIIILLFFSALSLMLLLKLVGFNRGMIEFHKFINSYRQTPRSRNLKKYQPPQEPIFEDLSQFERSQFGSIQIHQSEIASSYYGAISQNKQPIMSSHNDTKDAMSLNGQSQYGAHQSAIEFNEEKGIFEEVPVDDDYRGSFPMEDMNKSIPQRGYDIPDSEHNYTVKKGSIYSKKSTQSHLKKMKKFLHSNDNLKDNKSQMGTDIKRIFSNDSDKK